MVNKDKGKSKKPVNSKKKMKVNTSRRPNGVVTADEPRKLIFHHGPHFQLLDWQINHKMPLLVWLHILVILYLYRMWHPGQVIKHCRAIHILVTSLLFLQVVLVNATASILLVDQLDFLVFALDPMAQSLILLRLSTQMHNVHNQAIRSMLLCIRSHATYIAVHLCWTCFCF